ncbi:transposase [Micromonospora aurantiaca]|uniref:Transposase n=1 Tax=Micromonospora sp. HUAS YX12 TaxID=3156396 RepID=A0AAU7R705_9ACTN|nr:transposase [Micromonospora orduensis]
MPLALPSASAPVVIAIDPHKASWTAVAVDSRLQPVAAIRVEVNRDGYRQLRRFAGRWPHAVWAVEGAGGLGAALTARLTADDIGVVDVPAKLARRVRMLSTGHGRKTDQADALSVGIAAHTATGPNTAVVDEAIAVLRCLTQSHCSSISSSMSRARRHFSRCRTSSGIPARARRSRTASARSGSPR